MTFNLFFFKSPSPKSENEGPKTGQFSKFKGGPYLVSHFVQMSPFFYPCVSHFLKRGWQFWQSPCFKQKGWILYNLIQQNFICIPLIYYSLFQILYIDITEKKKSIKLHNQSFLNSWTWFKIVIIMHHAVNILSANSCTLRKWIVLLEQGIGRQKQNNPH